jgi:hypothetical protein
LSRLDSFIRRLEAQRACLDTAMRLSGPLPGIALELGLGNGRTYDHLRLGMPDREIFVFERRPDAHPDCTPDERHLVVGPLEETLVTARERLPLPAVLVHSDIGTGDDTRNARVAAVIARLLPPLLAPSAIVASDQALAGEGLISLALPAGVAQGRYHLYRYVPTSADRAPSAPVAAGESS